MRLTTHPVQGGVLVAFLFLPALFGLACASLKASNIPTKGQEQLPAEAALIATSGFTPGEVLDKLPRYPGAVGPRTIQPDLQFPSVASAPRACLGPRCPEFQLASVRLGASVRPIEIQRWYEQRFKELGYQHVLGGYPRPLDGGGEEVSLTYLVPTRPDLTIELHIRSSREGTGSVFQIQVSHLAPLPRPVEETIRDDIERIEIESRRASDGVRPTDEVVMVTDPGDIQRLTNVVNRLPVLPDWDFRCPASTSPAAFPVTTLRFMPHGGEPQVVRDIRGCPRRVEFNGYPTLYDPQSLLEQELALILGPASQ